MHDALQVLSAHSKGGVRTLVAHQHAPLMATSTSSQVVKVWTEHGDAVSVGPPWYEYPTQGSTVTWTGQAHTTHVF